MPKVIEAIASSVLDAKESIAGGAGRIELVSALSEGGLTPSFGLIEEILTLPIEVAIMLRPSSKSFVYRDDEFQVMRKDLLQMEKMGVKRVVVGALNNRGDVDGVFLKELFDGISLKATFHRAIDESKDLLKSLETISEMDNFTHVLTSGGSGKAVEHLDVLKEMMKGPLHIIVGSGVTLENAAYLQESFKDYEYDLHLGTALRHGDIHGSVDQKLVQKLLSHLK